MKGNEYSVVYESHSEDILVVQVKECELKPKPLALLSKDVAREPERIENRHPEGWPLCMHGVGYPKGKFKINERMKILHRDEMKHMAKQLLFWFTTIFDESKLPSLKPIALMLQVRANECNTEEEKHRVYYDFLFPSDDNVYFIGTLQHGASGCPCLVFDHYNDSVIQVVLLGACPKEIFAKAGAEGNFLDSLS